ncbi:E3 ubiquitin-protein ligase makorin-1 isoform X3 [Meriones unguiculatus]|uniref:E3 ubiquitin-protein ligase makorin-1 isoform X3 n=1 Tax=Meriones unguiculatus TaxID=10047 RepID=UPI00293EEE97|nr:E3 ubiquitin-protein ligase makorin-1 isoform X3 [Meriones unguiculatus]
MAEAAAPGTTATTSGAGAAAAAVAAASLTPIPTVAALSPGAGGGVGGSDGGGGGWTKQVTCRYFMHGVCKEGDNCRYSHDLSDSPYGIVCKYFQRGYCVYGDRCRYEHSKPLKQEEVTATDLSAKSSLAASSNLSSGVGSLAEMNSGEAESRNTNFATVGAGSEDWVNAIEFVPGQPYCGRTAPSCTEVPLQGSVTKEESEKEPTAVETKKQLCPYAAVGECRYGENCVYLHGDSCDMCGLQVLHPMDAAQRSQHIKSCIEAHEKDMELSFAVQRSKDMVCGICMEVVYEKASPSERRFGILSNCNHTYCLKCIRKWRSAKQFESKIIKSCPECRITSNFVIPTTRRAGILMKDVGAAHLEGTVFTSMRTLMAVERSHRDRKWEHQADTGPNEGATSGSSLRRERTTPLTTTKRRLSPLSWARCCLCFWPQVGTTS